MLEKRPFFREALSRSRKKTQEGAEETHVPLLLLFGVIVLLLAVFAGIPAAVHFHEQWGLWVVVVLVIAAAAAFVYWIAFGAYYSIYCDEARRADSAIAERDAARAREAVALARLKPKLEILEEEAEIKGRGMGVCRIRVKNNSDAPCRFGAEIKVVSFPVERLLLPFALRQTMAPKERIDVLPARQTRTVDVIKYSGGAEHLALLGPGESVFEIGAGQMPQRLTICAYCPDQEGGVAEVEFGFMLGGGVEPYLWAIPQPPALGPVAGPSPMGSTATTTTEAMPPFLERLRRVSSGFDRVIRAGWEAMRQQPRIRLPHSPGSCGG